MPHQFLLAKCGAEPHRASAYHVLPGLQCRDPFRSRRALGTPQVLPLDCPGHSALRAGDTGGRMDALELGISTLREFALLSEVSEICTCSLDCSVYRPDQGR